MADQQKSWYIEIGGKKVGPLAESDVINLHKAGKVSDTTRFIRDGMDNWVSLSETGIVNDGVPPLPEDDIVPQLPVNEDASSLQAQKAIKSVSASHFLTSGTLYLYEDKIEFVCNSTTSIPFCDVADVYLDKELIILKLTNGKDYFFDVIPESFLQEWVESIRAQWQVFNGRIEVEEAPPPLNDDIPPLDDKEILPLIDNDISVLPDAELLLPDDGDLQRPKDEIYDYQSSGVFDETQTDTPVSMVDNVLPSENKIDSAVKKASGIVENIRHEVTTSETIANLKTGAGSGIDTATKKVTELVDILPDNISSSKAAVNIKAKLQSKKSRTYFLIGLLILIAAVVLLLFVPLLRWILLIGALAWLGLCLYKKPIPIGKYVINVNTNKTVPIIISAISLALIIVLPSGSNITSLNSSGSTIRSSDAGTGSQSSGSSNSSTNRDFSSEYKVEAYFEALHPDAYSIDVISNVTGGYAYVVRVIYVGVNATVYYVNTDGTYDQTGGQNNNLSSGSIDQSDDWINLPRGDSTFAGDAIVLLGKTWDEAWNMMGVGSFSGNSATRTAFRNESDVADSIERNVHGTLRSSDIINGAAGLSVSFLNSHEDITFHVSNVHIFSNNGASAGGVSVGDALKEADRMLVGKGAEYGGALNWYLIIDGVSHKITCLTEDDKTISAIYISIAEQLVAELDNSYFYEESWYDLEHYWWD